MNRCANDVGFRECVLRQGKLEVSTYLPISNSRLGQDFTVSGLDGRWAVTRMSPHVICEQELRSKQAWRPNLYPILEVSP